VRARARWRIGFDDWNFILSSRRAREFVTGVGESPCMFGIPVDFMSTSHFPELVIVCDRRN
jgi:hypothetical protein